MLIWFLEKVIILRERFQCLFSTDISTVIYPYLPRSHVLEPMYENLILV